jgi:nucleoside-diphosphate-sugar epimerase
MTILVTGGLGFIGLNLREYYSHLNFPCILMSNDAPSEGILKSLEKHYPNFEWVQGDVRSAKDLDRVCQQFEIKKIVNAAAITAELAREINHAKTIFEVNLLGSIEVFECALRNQLEQVIQLSSGSLFGYVGQHDPIIDELTSPVLPETMYGISKLAAERVALRYRKTRNLNVTVVRLGLVYGQWEYDTGVRDTLSLPLQLYWMAKQGKKAIVFHEVGTDYIYSKDVAQGLGSILQAGSSPEGLYHLSSAQVWSLSTWLELLQKHFPDFSYEISEQREMCNVGLIGPLLRSPMSIDRIQRDFDYQPRFNQEQAFLDFITHHEEML